MPLANPVPPRQPRPTRATRPAAQRRAAAFRHPTAGPQREPAHRPPSRWACRLNVGSSSSPVSSDRRRHDDSRALVAVPMNAVRAEISLTDEQRRASPGQDRARSPQSQALHPHFVARTSGSSHDPSATGRSRVFETDGVFITTRTPGRLVRNEVIIRGSMPNRRERRDEILQSESADPECRRGQRRR